MTLGAAGYLTKPIDRERLIALLRPYQVSAGRTRMLLVEDDPAQRESNPIRAGVAAVAVTEAENGRVALERFAYESAGHHPA